MCDQKESLINRTRRVFEPRAGRSLSENECEEIGGNVARFLAVLADWQRKDDAAATKLPVAGSERPTNSALTGY